MPVLNYRGAWQKRNYCKKVEMKNKIFNEKELNRLFEQDAAGISPDAAVRDRLEYTFLLKSSSSKVSQNSFLGMFTWLFSWSQLPLKAAVVTAVVLISFIKFPSVESQFLLPGQDTTYNAIPLQIDSSEASPFFADTCLTTKTIIDKTKKSSNTVFERNETSLSEISSLQKSCNNLRIALRASFFLPRHLISRKFELNDSNKSALSEWIHLA